MYGCTGALAKVTYGLRRHEAVALRFDHLRQREKHWAIVDLVGEGCHLT
jgi:hypothetical protein